MNNNLFEVAMNNNLLEVLELLRNDGSIIVNKNLANNIGLNAASLYSELVSRYIYFYKRELLTKDGYFFNTIEDLKKGTTLSRRQQTSALQKLKDIGLIRQKNIGMPRKRYFKIINNPENIKKYLVDTENNQKESTQQKEHNSVYKKCSLVCSKSTTNNTINNINLISTTTVEEIQKDVKQKEVVVDKSFCESFRKDVKEKYNFTLNKRQLELLYKQKGPDILTKYYNDFEKIIFSYSDRGKEITNLGGLFRSAIINEYEIPKRLEGQKNQNKPIQSTNYEQRKYDDDYFDGLYANVTAAEVQSFRAM